MKKSTARVYKNIVERIPIEPLVGTKLLHSAASSLYLRSRHREEVKSDEANEGLLASIVLMAFVIAAHLGIDLQNAIKKQMEKYQVNLESKVVSINNIMKGVM